MGLRSYVFKTYCFQNEGINKQNTVTSSNRPKNIIAEAIHFAAQGNEAKLLKPPFAPKPGPMLLRKDTAPPEASTNPIPRAVKSNTPTI